MLKIKDNVDLKELKKYGFEYKVEDEYYELNVCKATDGFNGFVIYKGTRHIYNYSACENDTLDTLYDLIQAGLVEKVGEDNEI